jgi:hypothetical protein
MGFFCFMCKAYRTPPAPCHNYVVVGETNLETAGIFTLDDPKTLDSQGTLVRDCYCG